MKINSMEIPSIIFERVIHPKILIENVLLQPNQSLLINIPKIREPNFEAFNNPLSSNKVLSASKILYT